jgi:hypothetical protein
MTGERKWVVTPELKKRVESIRTEIDIERKEFENNPQLCPIHDKESRFVKREGAYTRGYAIFRCPEGHSFKVG